MYQTEKNTIIKKNPPASEKTHNCSSLLFLKTFKNKNPTQQNIVFYLNPLIMAIWMRDLGAIQHPCFGPSRWGSRRRFLWAHLEKTHGRTLPPSGCTIATKLIFATQNPLARAALGRQHTPAATCYMADEEPPISAPTISLSSFLSHVL